MAAALTPFSVFSWTNGNVAAPILTMVLSNPNLLKLAAVLV
jgi:hypothetical protein